MKIQFDYSKLLGRIKEKYGTQEKIAEKSQMSLVSLNKKLNNVVDFSQSDIFDLSILLEIEVDQIGIYFFTQNVKKT